MWLDSEVSLKVEEQQFGPWLHAPLASCVQKNVISVPGFFHKKKGSSTTQRASFQPRRAQANSMTVPPSPTTHADVEQNNVE